MDWLLSPEGGLWSLTAAAFLASTVLPLSSEAVLFGYLSLHPGEGAPAIMLATLANTVAWAQDTPELTQPVNDFAGVIDLVSDAKQPMLAILNWSNTSICDC